MSEREYNSLRHIIQLLSCDNSLGFSAEFLSIHKQKIPPRGRKKKQPPKPSNNIMSL